MLWTLCCILPEHMTKIICDKVWGEKVQTVQYSNTVTTTTGTGEDKE